MDTLIWGFMKFLILDTKNPHRNLAIEEYLFSEETDDVFMLWQNEPTVVIGKNQNPFAEINLEILRERGIHIARRITGGGAVYHDLGNVNYTFISKAGEGGGLDFARFTSPIIEALASVGVAATLTGRNDLAIGGLKFSGNAQHEHGGRILHHGTLLFDSDLDVLSSVLCVDEEKIRSKGVKSTRSRVTNLAPFLPHGWSVNDFISLLSDFVIAKFSPEIIKAPEDYKTEALYKKYSSDAWLFPASGIASEHTVKKKRRYPFGGVEVLLSVKGERICNLKITGDFFGFSDVAELESALCGARLSEVSSIISDFEVSNYLFGMTDKELAELILS